MITSAPPAKFDRYTQLADLAAALRRTLRRSLIPLAVLFAVVVARLSFVGNPGMLAFAFIAIGTLIVLAVWADRGYGLPLLPMFAAQHMISYGLPIAVNNEVVLNYPQSFVTGAGLEVLLFCGAMAVAWRIGMEMSRPAPPRCYALQGFHKDGTARLSRIGFTLVVVSTGFNLLQSMGEIEIFYALLPTGTNSILTAIISAVGMCGFFLMSMMLGSGDLSVWKRTLFWLFLALNCAILAGGFLLSAAGTLLGSVLIGLIWSTGRIPWRYLTVAVSLLAFFNLGKFTMRERYWGLDGQVQTEVALLDLPRTYTEWSQASLEIITGSAEVDDKTASKFSRSGASGGQSLLQRINNLQNMLYVIDALEVGHISPLGGSTYTIIVPLLIPRIIWPDKPRTHEGQVMLNVHFGRQDLASTFQTYIAWGLLPEACGNFGRYVGAIMLGLFLGGMSAWLENFTARRLVLSLEGFLSFVIFLGLANSFEMVASVMVTSIFQSIVPIILACMPFVELQSSRRPELP